MKRMALDKFGTAWRTLICIALAAMLTACSKEPVSVSGTDNKDIAVAELFTHKGVTVYRFYDANRWVYFTSKATDITSTHQEYCGKGCTRTMAVETRGYGGIDQGHR